MACLPVLAFLAGLNLIGFSLGLWDKAQARRGGLRISERLLLTLAVVGAWLGLIVAFLAVHHKIRKWSFLGRFLAATLANAILLLWIFDALNCVEILGN